METRDKRRIAFEQATEAGSHIVKGFRKLAGAAAAAVTSLVPTNDRPPVAMIVNQDRWKKFSSDESDKECSVVCLGRHDYRAGDTLIVVPSDMGGAVKKEIAAVCQGKLADLREHRVETESLEYPADIIDDLERCYPEITLDSIVTVVYWRALPDEEA